MTATTVQEMEEKAKERVLLVLWKEQRPLLPPAIIAAVEKYLEGSLWFEIIRRAIVSLLDDGRVAFLGRRLIRLFA